MLIHRISHSNNLVVSTCHRWLWRQQPYGSTTGSCFRYYNATAITTSLFQYRKLSLGVSRFDCGKVFGRMSLLPSTTTGHALVYTPLQPPLSRRWMGAANKHNRKKRIEKCDLDPDEQTMKPRFTEAMEGQYKVIEQRFVQKLDHERPGRHRGIECARQMVLEEKLEKKASTACGNLYLNTWIYRRFSLPLGYRRITDVPGVVLANTLIREGTTIRFERYKDPKLIILEMYRYPNIRPTKTQEKYLKMDAEAEMTPEEAGRILNFDDEDEFLIPEEQAWERRMLEKTMFAANPYSDRQERMRKRKP
jgi:hypothetical protein